MSEYQQPMTEPDVIIASLYDASDTTRQYVPVGHDEHAQTILRIKAMSVLERASKLQYLKPEPGWLEALQASASWSSSSLLHIDESMLFQGFAQEQAGETPKESKLGWTRAAKYRTPKAAASVRSALMRIEEELPANRQTQWWWWDGKIQDWHFGPNRKQISVTVS